MPEPELDALRALRREHAAVPAGARERGRRRVEDLLAGGSDARRPRPAGRRLVRGALAFVPVLLVVALALGVGGVLVLGDHQRRADNASPAPHPAITPSGLTATLAVLQRPQSDAERALVHRAATDRYAALPKFSDPDSVRILAPGVLGRQVFLYLRGTSVCVYYPDVEGGGTTCSTAAQLSQRRMIGALGTQVYGLVPDGVARVVITFPSGTVSLPIRDNFWQTRAPGATPSAIVWKDAQGQELDPAHSAQQSFTLAPKPPKVKVTRTDLHARVDVLAGRRVRFTPAAGGHRYEILLSCGKRGFDGAVTKPLPAGQAAIVPLKLAAARDQCPGAHAFAGQVIELTNSRPQSTRIGGTIHTHVTVLGRFRLSR